MTGALHSRENGKRYRIASRLKFTIFITIVILMAVFVIATMAGFNAALTMSAVPP